MSIESTCWKKFCKMLIKRDVPVICMVIGLRWARCYQDLWYPAFDWLCGSEVQSLYWNQGSWVRISLQPLFYLVIFGLQSISLGTLNNHNDWIDSTLRFNYHIIMFLFYPCCLRVVYSAFNCIQSYIGLLAIGLLCVIISGICYPMHRIMNKLTNIFIIWKWYT